MASQQHDTVFPEEDIDDDEDEFHEYEEDEEDDDVLVDDEETDPPSSSRSVPSVTVAVPGSVISNGVIRPPILTPTATTIVFPANSFPSDSKRQRIDQIEEKKPLEDSRKLFQRLWTDEDEMELLQGFLDYTTQRGSSHHNDTAQFYDQIKSKLQLDFNKNQLVEKIRRLKKKYRNVLNKISSGKEFVFKTAHDQATFEISRKIWNNVAPIAGDVAIDDDEINLNPSQSPNLNFSPVILKAEANSNTRKRSRPRSVIRTFEKRESIDGSNSIRDRDYLNINLNNPNPNPNLIHIPIPIPNPIPNPIHNPYATTTATTVNAAITPTITATTTTPNANTAINANNYSNNCSSIGNNVAGVIEETVRSCLSPVLKELVAGAGAPAMGGSVGGGARGGLGFSMNPLPFQFMNSGFMNSGFVNSGLGGGEMMDEKWRKQQILELEVYSKRLELVQDQIKASLDELRGSGG